MRGRRSPAAAADSGTQRVKVGFLGLGPGGDRLARAAAATVSGAWRRLGRIETAVATADAPRELSRTLRLWADRERFDAVFTVGRAGPAREDFAPEATAALLERRLPGVEERMHLAPAAHPEELLFRGRAGMRKGTLVVNLPERAARARAVAAFLAPVLTHAVGKARGDDGECARPAPRR